MRIRTLFLIIGIVAIAATSSFAQVNGMYGRNVAEAGTMDTIEGTLTTSAGEWLLNVGDLTYNLHLGRYGHETDLALSEGASARVTGFVVDMGIAPVSIETEGEQLAFWQEDGYPLWAGRGARADVERREQPQQSRGRAMPDLERRASPQQPQQSRGRAMPAPRRPMQPNRRS